MSETAQFASNEIRDWLEKETVEILSPVQEEASQLCGEMDAAIQNLVDASRVLLDNSNKDIERENKKVYKRAKALNKLSHLFLERLRKLKIPSKVTYESLSVFVQETQKAFLTIEIDIKNWFPKISPFFILDRRRFLSVYEKSKASLKTLKDFLTDTYIKTKTLEDTFQLISDLQSLEKKLLEVEAQIAKIENERSFIQAEVDKLRQRTSELRSKGTFDQLRTLGAEAEMLNRKLGHDLRHLRKAFLKMKALAFRGGGVGLTQTEIKKIGQYMEKPFEALTTEEPGIPVFKLILEELGDLMDKRKLKLKSDKARKAKQAIANILNQDSLAGLKKKSDEVAKQKKQLTTSKEIWETRSSLNLLQERTTKLRARQANLEADKKEKEDKYNKLLSEIQDDKKEIESNTLDFLGQKVKIT